MTPNTYNFLFFSQWKQEQQADRLMRVKRPVLCFSTEESGASRFARQQSGFLSSATPLIGSKLELASNKLLQSCHHEGLGLCETCMAPLQPSQLWRYLGLELPGQPLWQTSSASGLQLQCRFERPVRTVECLHDIHVQDGAADRKGANLHCTCICYAVSQSRYETQQCCSMLPKQSVLPVDALDIHIVAKHCVLEVSTRSNYSSSQCITTALAIAPKVDSHN